MKNLFQQEESYFPEDIARGKYDSLGWNKYTYVPNIYAINCLIYIRFYKIHRVPIFF